MKTRDDVLMEAARAMCPHCLAGLAVLYGVPDRRFSAWSHRRPVRQQRGEPYTIPVGCKAGPIHELRSEETR